MKKSLLVFALALVSTSAFAQVHVDGYTRRDGTYVQPHERSAPNGTVTDNYSFKGNSNPYTGSTGTNSYQHDVTSPNFNGTPHNQGNYGHSGNGRGY
ncbi:MAG: hypothetical protein V4735_08960 [Pseudomonadota bacterium]